MKNIVFAFLFLSISCYALAQNPISSILKNSPFRNTFNSNNVEKSICELSDVWKIDGNGVSFVITVDSLSLSASEILAYSTEYFEEAYRPSKYEIETVNKEKLFVIGKGEFNNFESYAAFPNQYSFNCEHKLRVDAKEGRARLCFTVFEYDVLRINGNNNERKKINVMDVYPANPNEDSSRKMYGKVFLTMAKFAMGTLLDLQETLKSKQSSVIEDW